MFFFLTCHFKLSHNCVKWCEKCESICNWIALTRKLTYARQTSWPFDIVSNVTNFSFQNMRFREMTELSCNTV